MCLASPSCASGPSGPSGATGPAGKDGTPGFQGVSGPQGQQGVQGFNGTKGDTGGTGPSGASGPQGSPGVCDCFNQTVTYNELNITTGLNLGPNSTFSCGQGATIQDSCLVVGNCPNFSMCSLQSLSLLIGGSSGSYLRVGYPFGPTQIYAQFGASNLANYYLNLFQVYASGVVIEGNAAGFGGNTIIRAKNGGTLILDASGPGALTQITAQSGIIINAIIGSVSVTSNSGPMLFFSNDPMSTMQFTSQNTQTFNANGGPTTFNTAQFTVNKLVATPNGLNWFGTSTNAISYVNFTQLFSTPSIFFTEAILLGTNTWISSTDSIVRLGPVVNVGSGLIYSSSNNITLEQGRFDLTESIYLNAPVGNSATLPNLTQYLPTGFVSMPGQLNNGYLYLNDTDGTRISGGNVLIDKNLTVLGDVFVYGTVNASFPSDRRLKTNVSQIASHESIDRIGRLEPVHYRFKDERYGMGTHMRQGFIAQNVQQVYPDVVKETNRFGLDHFLTLNDLERPLMADMVRMMQYMWQEIQTLKDSCKCG